MGNKIKNYHISIAVFLAIVVGVLFGGSQTTLAACASPLPSGKGTATFTMQVPASGTYRLWTHMLAPTTASNATYLRVDDTHCQITVGDSSHVSANQFSWIDYQGGNTGNKIDLILSAGNHTFTYAGLDEGVGIDKMILVLDGACSPIGDGSNCIAASASTPQAQTAQQNPDTGTTGDSEITSKDSGSRPESAQSKLVGSIKSPLVVLSVASIFLATSAIAILWAFRPGVLRGLPSLLRVMLGRQSVGLGDGQSLSSVVVGNMHTNPSYKWWGVTGAIGFGAVGLGLMALTFAASSSGAFMLTSAQLSNGASVTNHSAAIGGKMVRFASPTASTPTPSPTQPTQPTQPSAPTCGAGTIGIYPNCYSAPPFSASAGKSWKVSFSEEFNGSGYDPTKLTPCFDWNYGGCTSTFNNGRETYMPSQVVVNNGTAKLIAAPLSPPYSSSACQNNQCTYKAGLLSTARPRADNGSGYLYKFTYGYVESRFKFPATQGFFTAFWMLPAEPSYDYRSEIDILELLGDDPTTMFMTYHYNNRSQSYTPNNGKFNNGACAVKNYSTDFVRMGLDWQPDHVAWYIDGVKCGQFNGNASTIENGPMQLILHMMVDNNWQRSWNVGLLDPTLTRQLEVDYIRVYQQQ